MSAPRLRRFLISVWLVIAAVAPATAQTATGSQLWVQGLAVIPLSENWRVHLEEQPRWDDDATQTYQVLTRTAIGRRLGNRLSVWAGHAWVAKPNPSGVAHEQRAWEQLLITLPEVGGWAPAVRVRTEQRWQRNWADWSHRVRIMGRGVRRLSETSKWSAILWQESFFSLDETASGPPSGVDQHRLFGGTGRRLSRSTTLETGYFHVIARRRDAPMKHTPGALASLNMSF